MNSLIILFEQVFLQVRVNVESFSEAVVVLIAALWFYLQIMESFKYLTYFHDSPHKRNLHTPLEFNKYSVAENRRYPLVSHAAF